MESQFFNRRRFKVERIEKDMLKGDLTILVIMKEDKI